jgi:hypothetical protein
MSYSYQNRFGKKWCLLRKTSKTGKEQFYFSQKPGGDAPDLPPGYEAFENAQGQVFLRKQGSAEIRQSEVDRAAAHLRRLGKNRGFEAWPAKNTVTIYEFNRTSAYLAEALGLPLSSTKIQQADYNHGGRMPLLRFVLADAEQRTFFAQRYCFRGSVDDWIDLAGPGNLDALCRKFTPHLGQDSFYELTGF